MMKKKKSNSTLTVLMILTAALFLCVVIVLLQRGGTAGDAQLSDGTYDITVESSSSMFRIDAARLTVKGGAMEACLTLSGKGYGKLFMGTGEEASAAAESAYIPYVEDSAGKYTYTVPVAALDTEIDCAAWSIKKEKWYDRVLVFSSEGIPDGAYRTDGTMQLILGWGVVVGIAFLSAGGVLWGGNRKKGK